MSMFNLAISCLLFSRLVVSNSLQIYGLQHTRLPYLLPSPEICSNLCTLSQWCHPTILCCPLLLPSIFPGIRVFSNESLLHIRWLKYWSFSFSIRPSSEYSGLISWLGLTGFISLLSKGLSSVFSSPQFESINSSMPSLLYSPTLTSTHDSWKNHSFDYIDICWQNDISAF